MIRVLHIIAGLGSGGAERQLYLLVTNLRNGYEHKVVSLIPGGMYEGQLKDAGAPAVCLGVEGWRSLPGGLRSLSREIRAFRPNVVHCWMYHANYLGMFSVAGLRSRPALIWGVRTDIKGGELRARTKIMARFGAALAGFADAVVYNSETSARNHESMGYPASRTRVIANGIDLECFRPSPAMRAQIRHQLGLLDHEIVIGMAARFHPAKDHSTLLAAIRQLLDRGVKVRLMLVGAGMDKSNTRMQQIMVRTGLESNVILLGERSDVPDVMCAMDIACLSSHREGFPNTVVEAMACGIPCVATGVGDIPAIINDPELVVPPADASALCAALDRLCRMPKDERDKIGRKARKRVIELYSKSAMCGKYDSLYRSLIGRSIQQFAK